MTGLLVLLEMLQLLYTPAQALMSRGDVLEQGLVSIVFV